MIAGDLSRLDPWDEESGALQVVIETPKGSRNKYKYDPDSRSFLLNKVLPCGMDFPFDFGFVPSTQGEDGDPLDILVLMDEPAFAGCRIKCRLLGVIEGEQTHNGKTERNDRLIAVAEQCYDFDGEQSVKDLNQNLLKELEHFFVSYHDLDDTEYKLIGCRGPNKAEKLIKEGMKCCRRKGKTHDRAAHNGKVRAAKK
jgi:inorganic pyrophosphatase